MATPNHNHTHQYANGASAQHTSLNMPSTQDPTSEGAAAIGVGQVHDPNMFSGVYPTSQSSGAPYQSHRTQYFLSRQEILSGVANRFVHSSTYLYFYASMAVVSLLTVIISLTTDCPGSLFYTLEFVINSLLILEVGIRLVAFGKKFWKSWYNVLDLGLVLFCSITLLVIFFNHDCSPFHGGYPDEDDEIGGGGGRTGKNEELLDSILLIARNVVQALRLVSIVRRSGSNVTSRPTRIEIGNNNHSSQFGTARSGAGFGGGIGAAGAAGVAGGAYSLDLDLEDEGAMARDRIRIGNEERAPLFDATEEYDEDEEL